MKPNQTPITLQNPSTLIMDRVYSTLDQKSFEAFCLKYHITTEYQPTLPTASQSINNPPSGMTGVYVSYFEDANLRFPLRPFFCETLNKSNIPLYQLQPFSVLQLLSFEMMCNAFNISPTYPLFKHFFKFSHSESNPWYSFDHQHGLSSLMRIRGKQTVGDWNTEFFFVNLDMMTGLVIDQKEETFRQQDAELLSRHTFKIGPLTQELLWESGFSTFKCAGDKEPTLCDYVDAACLLKNNYIEVLGESNKTAVVADEQDHSDSDELEKLSRECDDLKTLKSALLDKKAKEEARRSSQQSQIKKLKVDYKKKLLELVGNKMAAQSARTDCCQMRQAWETKERYFAEELASTRKQIDQIANKLKEFVEYQPSEGEDRRI